MSAGLRQSFPSKVRFAMPSGLTPVFPASSSKSKRTKVWSASAKVRGGQPRGLTGRDATFARRRRRDAMERIRRGTVWNDQGLCRNQPVVLVFPKRRPRVKTILIRCLFVLLAAHCSAQAPHKAAAHSNNTRQASCVRVQDGVFHSTAL